jgi:hypothetical protein
MSGISAGAARAIAARFSWSHHKTFADIGAAQGMVPATLAIAHPHLRGIGFDLPQVQPVFEEFVAGLGPSDRVQFQKGNFFEEELPRTDVIENGARSAQFGDLHGKGSCSPRRSTHFQEAVQLSSTIPSSAIIAGTMRLVS